MTRLSWVKLLRDRAVVVASVYVPIVLVRFRGELAGLLDLTIGFYGLLEEWGLELDEVLEEVERHRAAR
ncbi:MAG: hypothetical protein HKO77_09825 [Gemmatimonadetes bacterium]|nr:hypothetical protein [Gemmatimonadota bacterium]